MGGLSDKFINRMVNPDTQELTKSGKRFLTWDSSIGFATSLGSGIIDQYSQSIQAKSAARIAEINRAAEEAAYKREVEYMNEEAAKKGWAEYEDMEDFVERQRLLSSLSGSSGAGEERIISDTKEKYRQEHEAALRALNVQSYERWVGSQQRQLEYDLQSYSNRQSSRGWLLRGVSEGVQSGATVVKASTEFFSDYFKWARNNGKSIKSEKINKKDLKKATDEAIGTYKNRKQRIPIKISKSKLNLI